MVTTMARADILQVLLEEMRALRSDMGVVKEQVIKTNGRVTNAERDIVSIKAATAVLEKSVSGLNSESLVHAQQEKDAAKRLLDKRWMAEYLQKWGPVVVSAGMLFVAVIIK